ncbi:phage tail assembly chaperone [Altererythrobacter sp. H2]|uniref:phage tail assembly chaperone n=1 Tax=Altererythrobacter sp. H2 TaxID=3108391 RepID=UPI002B4BFF74|nr:phage tail assembly chaperone [Altererythrobacter sp. H2]WRK96333.1 phage tail assembly chaperone [Altererythrobacter sp. H2]
MSDRFDAQVARLLPLAARALGWAPDTFWSATPADLAMALADPAASSSSLTRAELDHLLETDDHG